MNANESAFYQRLGIQIDERLLYSADNNLIHQHLISKLKSISDDLERQAKNYKPLSEDGLSGIFVTALNQSSLFQAQNEAFSNGHVDISITCLSFKQKHEFTCLGEAKIWNGQKYALQGIEQIDRYLTGRHDKGFMLYYFKTKNCDLLFDGYLDRIAKDGIADVFSRNTRHAITKHIHSSGRSIFLDHLAVNLHF